MTEPNELNRLINAVVEAREKSRLLSDERKSMYDAFIGEHTDFFSEVAQANSDVGEAEDELRKMALQFYSDTGEKQVAQGVGIRVRSVLNYDSKDAFAWALEHKIALKLDGSAFEQIVKTASETRPSFVTITEEPQATIATELLKVE